MESLHQLEERLGYTFTNIELLRGALYHSSYANEHRAMGVSSNERLEFLGDAVLGFVSADFLYRKHPDLPEGELTRIRAALVCEESLYEVAQGLHLGDYLLLGKGEESGAAAAVRLFWRTPWRQCWPPYIWTAASKRPAP